MTDAWPFNGVRAVRVLMAGRDEEGGAVDESAVSSKMSASTNFTGNVRSFERNKRWPMSQSPRSKEVRACGRRLQYKLTGIDVRDDNILDGKPIIDHFPNIVPN